MPEFGIRPFHTSDLYMLYRICLLTGADGEDASGTIDDELLGHFFAAPYAVLEPDLCFILTRDGAPCGYILGTADSVQFAKAMGESWLPPLRVRYPMPDKSDKSREAGMIRALHAGYRAPAFSDEFPAHLHIDILPAGQGSGHGVQLIERFLNALRHAGVKGVHLGVSPANERAVRFYPKCGFTEIERSDSNIYFGQRLTAS